MSDSLIKIAEDSVRGSFFLVSGAFIATVISSISTIIVARLLGPELYGQYVLSLVIPQMLVLFAGFGIGQGVIKFTSSLRAEGKQNDALQIAKYGAMVRGITGLAFFLLNFIFADFLASTILNRPELGLFVRIASITIIFQVVGTSATSSFLGLDLAHYHALTSIIERISKAAVSIALVLVGFNVSGAVLGHVGGWIAGGLFALSVLFVVLRKSTGSISKVDLASTVNKLISYGLPLYSSKIVVGFIPIVQSLVLALFTTDVAIGNLKAATNFITLVAVVSTPISTALFPAFSKLSSRMTERIKIFFKLANKYTTLVIIPITTVLMVLSNEVVQVIYGSTYVTAAYFLSIYCLLYFLVGFGYITLSSLLNGLGATGTTLRMSVITLIAIIGLSPVLTSIFGVPGLIFSLLAASAVSMVYGIRDARLKFQIEFDKKSLSKIYAVGLASALPLLLMLRISTLPSLLDVIIGGLLYMFVYATLAPIAGIFDASELEMVSGIAEKIRILSPFIKPLIRYEKMLLDRIKPLD